MPGVFRTTVAYGRESTYGTTAGALTFIPVVSLDTYDDDEERIVDSGLRGYAAKDFAIYTGVRRSQYSLTSYHFADEITPLWAHILGIDTVSQTSVGAPGLHNIGMANLPPSVTWIDFMGTNQRTLRGMQMERLEMNWKTDQGLITMRPSYRGFTASTSGSQTSQSYGTDIPYRPWQGLATFPTTGTQNSNMLEFGLTVQRPVELVFGMSTTQDPTAREVGPLEVTARAVFYTTGDDTIYNYYKNNTTGALYLQFVDSVAAPASSMNRLQLFMSNFYFEKVTPDRGGVYTRWDVQGRALWNSGDSGPLRVQATISTTSGFSS